nr:nuclear transport factor 2 family protein [Acinetobacter sp. Marseille-Q1620]
MSQLELNKTQAKRFLEYLTKSDFENLHQLLADEMQYILPGKSPIATHLTSAAEFSDFVQSAFSGKVKNAKIEISNIIAEDNLVALEATGLFEFNNGLIYENIYHFLFHFNEQNLITKLTEHMDSYHASKLFA